MTLPTVLAILPLVIFTVLLLSGRTLLSASFVVFAGYLLFGLFYFNVDPTLALAVIGKGALTAKDIFWIVFGALFFLEVLKLRLVLPALVKYLQTISADYRVQILLLVWFLEAFIEGTAGFGTPVALVSPILVAMGYSPLRAVALGLLGNSNAVVFGAAGTPIRVGFAGLDVVGVPTAAALFNLCGIFVPVLILWLGVRKRNDFWPFVPLALWAGVCLMVAEIVIVPLGSELPSILGPIVGLIIFLASQKILPHRPSMVIAAPYCLLIGLLIIFKSPALAFLFSGLPFLFIWGGRRKIFSVLKPSISGAFAPFWVVCLMTISVQLMTISGVLNIIARMFTNNYLPLLAPFLGAFGAFLTGSATVSNLMFGKIVSLSALELGLNNQLILGVLVVGGAVGNMIALADMLAAQAIVGLKNQEREVLKLVILPCLAVLLLLGIFATITLHVF